MKDLDRKIVQLTIEEIIKLLINLETGQDNDAGLSKSQSRVFKAKQNSRNNTSYQSKNPQTLIPKSIDEN